MEDSSIKVIRSGKLLGRPYGLYWPRHVYGRVVEELCSRLLANPVIEDTAVSITASAP